MNATVLIDNLEGCGLTGEWGLSLYIEHGGHVILLDELGDAVSQMFTGCEIAIA